MSYTTVVAGQAITASWGNANVRDQVVTPFASVAARDSAITAPVTGMVAVTTDAMYPWLRKAGAWRALLSAPNPYRCWAGQSVGQSVAPGFAVINFGANLVDPSSWHSTSVNTNRITPTVAGIITFAYQITTNATAGWTTAYVRKNGASALAGSQNTAPVGADWALSGFGQVDVNGTDYIELYFGQGAAGSVTTDSGRTQFMAWMESWS